MMFRAPAGDLETAPTTTPRVSASGSPGPRMPHQGGGSTKPALVLGDGYRLFVDALALTLTDRGYPVRSAATTCVALLRAVLVHRPDACLVELQLRDGCAIDVIERIHLRFPDLKVLVLSTGADPRSVAAAIEAGAVGVLSKDGGIDVIERALERLGNADLADDGVLTEKSLRDLSGHDRKAHAHPLGRLTHREREVLRRLTKGESTAEVARSLGVSRNTARTHVQSILDKLGVHSQLEAVALANRTGLMDWRITDGAHAAMAG